MEKRGESKTLATKVMRGVGSEVKLRRLRGETKGLEVFIYIYYFFF